MTDDRFEWGPWMTRKPLLQKPVHRWYTFPHSFASELVHSLIDEWHLTSSDLILDPFVGAGTTLLAAKERQIAAKGYDISPLAELVSRVKLANYKTLQLRSLFEVLDQQLDDPHCNELSLEDHPRLLRNALPDSRLREFANYSETICQLPCSRTSRDFFRLALIAIIPKFSHAQATGGWLKWSNPKNTDSTIKMAFNHQVNTMIGDTSKANTVSSVLSTVDLADARRIPDDDQTYTAVITSPPYPNRHDYTRIFGVELLFAFLSEHEIRQLRYQTLHSHPEARPTRPDSTGYSCPHGLLSIVSDLQELRADPRVSTMLHGYFRDIYLCLREASRVCKPAAKLAFVVGNVRYAGRLVPVDELTAELGTQVGLSVRKIYVGRYRGNSAQQMGRYGRQPSREAVVLFERR